MTIYNDLVNKKEKLSVIGLGYVGLPIAVEFAKKVDVVGFDINVKKIEQYKNGIDPTNEVGSENIKRTSIAFTSDEQEIQTAKFHIVAVPTPIHPNHTPNLTPLEQVSRLLGRNLTKGSIVVFESTVFPGVTEDICIPLLEKESGLKSGEDFTVGYSPERINPGDKVNRLDTIVKIVSGMDAESLESIAAVYELVVQAGVHKASSIKVAEAAKVIENAQRDINIAFMNELCMIFNQLDIDTNEVLEAAKTKWNFLDFHPGLVGGHCIGVDPYYLTYKAEQEGYHSQIILSGRRINDGMGRYVAENIVKKLTQVDVPLKNARVGILGFTFKENIPDSRNSKIIDIISELKEYGIESIVSDPVANEQEAFEEHGVKLNDLSEIKDMDAIVLAVNHKEFSAFEEKDIDAFFKQNDNHQKVLIDVKSILDRKQFESLGYKYWRL